MPVEGKVGPPTITINQGSTFMVTDQRGAIDAASEQGVFAGDTRFVSHYQLFIDGKPWELLTSSAVNYYAARIHLANPDATTQDGPIPVRALALVVTRTVGDGIHEDLDVTNYSLQPVRFQLEVALRSDFADLFEVKSHRFVRRGNTRSAWDEERSELTNTYVNEDFRRQLAYRVLNNDSPVQYANGRVVFDLALEPGQSWHTCAFYVLTE